MKKPKGTFMKACIFLVCFYGLGLKICLPYLGGWLAVKGWTEMREGLPSSGHEVTIYFTLACLATFAYASYSEERWQEFKRPIIELLRGKTPWRTAALILFPLVCGGLAFWNMTSETGASSFVALKHPTPPDQYSKMKNPYRNPGAEMLQAFEMEVKEGKIKKKDTTEEALVEYIEALEKGNASEAMRAKAFERKVTEEGRILFVKNCRPCHGVKAMGDGPMARGLLREPADFTGVETIATLVEGAVFWRIKTGGIGLPHEGGPWESAMPPWGEEDLTDDEIWKIILAEYDIAGNNPREPEKLD
ncbi:MAG: cytochrome c [Candidatus Hydrogenedentes bacterium]|nr:cytochrome c [Candidatus Hydrogenedentota bacterium]